MARPKLDSHRDHDDFLAWGLLFCFPAAAFFLLGCGGLFATTSTARSKRCHASGSSSISFFFEITMEKTTHAPKSSEQKRAQRDYAEMRIAVATALESWAELENDLARLLHLLLGFPTPDLGLVIYYSPSSLETRMSIVDDVFQCRVPLLAHGDDIVVCWNGFYDAFRSAKIARNNIVHGNIRSYSLNNSKKWQVRLTAPVLDPMRQKNQRAARFRCPEGQQATFAKQQSDSINFENLQIRLLA